MMDSLGNDEGAPVGTGYAMSVFTAWKISIKTLPSDASNFLYLLCFLDRTNLTKDLFKRACTPKCAWNNQGRLTFLHPRDNHVPAWLLDLFCSSDSGWSDFKFNGVVKRISDLFFLRKEKYEGPLMHQSGTIDSSAVTSDGSHPVILVLPQPLHDLGKFFLSKDKRRQFVCDAFSVVVHAFPNDIVLNRTLDKDAVPIKHVGLGGAMSSRQKLVIGLEEIFRHVNALKEHAAPPSRSPSESQLWPETPMLQQAEAILMASTYWPSLVFESERPTPWPLLTMIPQIILGQRPSKADRRWDATWKAGDMLEDDDPDRVDREDHQRIERMLGSPSKPVAYGTNGLLRPSYDTSEDDEEFNRLWLARNVAYHVNLDRALKGYLVVGQSRAHHMVNMQVLAETEKANIIYHVAAAAEWRAHHLPEWTFNDELLDSWMIKVTSTIGNWNKFTGFNVKAHKAWLLSEMCLDFTIRCGEPTDIPLLEAERCKLLEDTTWQEEPKVIIEIPEEADEEVGPARKSSDSLEGPHTGVSLERFFRQGAAGNLSVRSFSSMSSAYERRPKLSLMKRIRLRLRRIFGSRYRDV